MPGSPAGGNWERHRTSFHSILSPLPWDGDRPGATEVPAIFADLNLDQVVGAMTAGREEYDLESFFYGPLCDVDVVSFRQEVLRDLEDDQTLGCIGQFTDQMRELRLRMAQVDKLRYPEHQHGWFLAAVETYCTAVRSLADQLCHSGVRSRGLLGLRDYLTGYVGSEGFVVLEAEAADLRQRLAAVHYGLHMSGGKVRVSRFDGEPDFSAEVERTFAKFKHAEGKDHRAEVPQEVDMDHVEAQILAFVAKLFPDVFGSLSTYVTRRRDFLDATVVTFDREVQFYRAYLQFIAPMKYAGLTFCYPSVSATSKELRAVNAFDVALASRLVTEREGTVVGNDFSLTGPERLLVVTGPNQGGKTTFARTFGQLHYLASLGFPVAAAQAQLFLPDQIFTHFERQENLTNLRGKLEDELSRFRTILARATTDSILIINEGFTSTTLDDAQFLGEQILRRIMSLDMLGVCVTFVDELTTLGEQTVSMASTVAPDDPTRRTFKVVRKPADGLAYAAALAKKHGLDYPTLKGRIA